MVTFQTLIFYKDCYHISGCYASKNLVYVIHGFRKKYVQRQGNVLLDDEQLIVVKAVKALLSDTAFNESDDLALCKKYNFNLYRFNSQNRWLDFIENQVVLEFKI